MKRLIGKIVLTLMIATSAINSEAAVNKTVQELLRLEAGFMFGNFYWLAEFAQESTPQAICYSIGQVHGTAQNLAVATAFVGSKTAPKAQALEEAASALQKHCTVGLDISLLKSQAKALEKQANELLVDIKSEEIL